MTEQLQPNRDYVAGFLFNVFLDGVLLIEKKRPQWQAGKLNAVGGAVEAAETPIQAMHREFKEETGLEGLDWKLFCVLSDARGWTIYFYRAVGKVGLAKTTTDERLMIRPTNDLGKVIPNLRWLVPMALSMKTTEGVSFYEIREKS